MHIAIFADQPLDSLGGAQVSIALQQKWLERAGHLVTVVAPASAGTGWWPQLRRNGGDETGKAVATPSVKFPPFGHTEYALSGPGQRTDAYVDAAFEGLPPVEVVHIQADFWGAFTGLRFAERHGLPVVHTLHNRVEAGLNALSPRLYKPLMRGIDKWRSRALSDATTQPTTSAWQYLRALTANAAAVTAPSRHFAERLQRNGVAREVTVVPNGIDDDALAAARNIATEPRTRPRFVWSGRMSPEKRFLPFVKAFVSSGIDADLDLIGSGGDRAKAERIVRESGAGGVQFLGRLPYEAALSEMARADALVQTSVGFETQAMTVFEAAALGTPAVVCDDHVAAELGAGHWFVPRSQPADLIPLMQTLHTAASELRTDRAPLVASDIGDRLRQSKVTEQLIVVYENVLAAVGRVR